MHVVQYLNGVAKAGKTKRYTDINDGFIEKTEFDLLKENIRRAEKHITDMETRLAELSQKAEPSQEEKLKVGIFSI